jgi:hypothetical protein
MPIRKHAPSQAQTPGYGNEIMEKRAQSTFDRAMRPLSTLPHHQGIEGALAALAAVQPDTVFRRAVTQERRAGSILRKEFGLTLERFQSAFRAEPFEAVLANQVFLFVISFSNNMGMQQREDISALVTLDFPSAQKGISILSASVTLIHMPQTSHKTVLF